MIVATRIATECGQTGNNRRKSGSGVGGSSERATVPLNDFESEIFNVLSSQGLRLIPQPRARKGDKALLVYVVVRKVD
jgi:hypothetical protein